MAYESAVLVYAGVKHENHNEIMHNLVGSGHVEEIDVLRDERSCSKSALISEKIRDVDVLIVYISKSDKSNACIEAAILVAKKRSIRVVVIWLGEDGSASDVGDAVGKYADCVMPYSSENVDIFLREEPVWKNADGSPLDKRKIKKHTCG